jgi:hypothetical protein
MRASGGDDIERQRVRAHRITECVAQRAMDLFRARGKHCAFCRLCNIVGCAKHGDRARACRKHSRARATALG